MEVLGVILVVLQLKPYTPTNNFTVQTRFKRIAFVYYDTNGNGIFDEPISCARTDSNIITINPKADFDAFS